MSIEQHLVMRELTLAASSDWLPRPEGWLVLRVATGVGYWLKAGGQVKEFGPGHLMIASESCVPTLRVSALGPVQIQFFTLQPKLLSGLLTMDEMRAFSPLKSGDEVEPAFLAHDDLLAKRWGNLAESPEELSAATRIRMVNVWIDALAKMNLPAAPAAREVLPLRERFRQLVRQLPAGEWSRRRIDELAAGLGCSPRHFHRLFREEFGESLRSFQTNLRLTRARKFLAESNTKIINVAQESGYNHLGLFNSMFKRRFGMTPGDWRRQARKEPQRVARRQLTTR